MPFSGWELCERHVEARGDEIGGEAARNAGLGREWGRRRRARAAAGGPQAGRRRAQAGAAEGRAQAWAWQASHLLGVSACSGGFGAQRARRRASDHKVRVLGACRPIGHACIGHDASESPLRAARWRGGWTWGETPGCESDSGGRALPPPRLADTQRERGLSCVRRQSVGADACRLGAPLVSPSPRPLFALVDLSSQSRDVDAPLTQPKSGMGFGHPWCCDMGVLGWVNAQAFSRSCREYMSHCAAASRACARSSDSDQRSQPFVDKQRRSAPCAA